MSMSNFPWLSFHHTAEHTTLVEHKQAYSSLDLPPRAHAKTQCPTLIAFIGRSAKAAILRHIFAAANETIQTEPHGQVRICSLPRTRREDFPIILADCEVHNERISQARPFSCGGPEIYRRVRSSLEGEDETLHGTQRGLGLRLYAQALAPLLGVLCLFAADMGGFYGVSETLALYIRSSPGPQVPQAALPRVLIVLSTYSASFDGEIMRRKFIDSVVLMLRGADRLDNDLQETEAMIFSHFNNLHVIGLAATSTHRDRQKCLYSRLMLQANEAYAARCQVRSLFAFGHMRAFMGAALDNFASGSTTALNLIRASRLGLGSCTELTHHLIEVISKMLTLSAEHALFASSHTEHRKNADVLPDFSPVDVFGELYEHHLVAAVNTSIELAQSGRQSSFISTVLDAFIAFFEQLAKASPKMTAASLHATNMRIHHARLRSVKSNRSCLCCLMRMPEKVLDCGHALCDVCVRIFGERSCTQKHSYTITTCVLCGVPNQSPNFNFVPPTAGIRILALDGGGIRGVIPLTFLMHLQQDLTTMLPSSALQDHFDLVCGTSSGGLIALGLFLKRWTPRECLQNFEDLASSIFKRRTNSSHFLAKIHELFVSYLADCRYDSSAIERAFHAAFGTVPMFNPLRNDTKVAVTTTTARESVLCLCSNYNGGLCPEDSGYTMLRAQKAEQDIFVSEAARCTSAAPWYFKPKFLEHLGTFQDGGLRHTNPLVPALWEANRIWPGMDQPDFALSLGTGTVQKASGFRVGSISPIRDRFLPRLFKTLMLSMDGEKAWSELVNTLSPAARTRLHRFNMPLARDLELDDITAITGLKQQASEYVRSNESFRTLRNSVYASVFYLELEEMPMYVNGGYRCLGNIFCRLGLSDQGRRSLSEYMKTHRAYFLVDGHPVACVVDEIPVCAPPFKRRVSFTLQSLDDTISISLRDARMLPRPISGLPKSLRQLIHLQSLDCPFGRIDHTQPDKVLPVVPSKRPAESSVYSLRKTRRNSRNERVGI
ncbi:MAG: hypothetical protein M1828_007013 [Chrysothrix sp. TS-e1954]|nr:MAG: hypothetical protein M1828_007013 [Chrysothrix sp. TS-e1954]